MVLLLMTVVVIGGAAAAADKATFWIKGGDDANRSSTGAITYSCKRSSENENGCPVADDAEEELLPMDLGTSRMSADPNDSGKLTYNALIEANLAVENPCDRGRSYKGCLHDKPNNPGCKNPYCNSPSSHKRMIQWCCRYIFIQFHIIGFLSINKRNN